MADKIEELQDRIIKLENTQFRWVTIGIAVAVAMSILGIEKWRSIPETIDQKVEAKVKEQVESKVGPTVLAEIESNRRKAEAETSRATEAADLLRTWSTSTPVFKEITTGQINFGDFTPKHRLMLMPAGEVIVDNGKPGAPDMQSKVLVDKEYH